jgi:hypothetical protein
LPAGERPAQDSTLLKSTSLNVRLSTFLFFNPVVRWLGNEIDWMNGESVGNVNVMIDEGQLHNKLTKELKVSESKSKSVLYITIKG